MTAKPRLRGDSVICSNVHQKQVLLLLHYILCVLKTNKTSISQLETRLKIITTLTLVFLHNCRLSTPISQRTVFGPLGDIVYKCNYYMRLQ